MVYISFIVMYNSLFYKLILNTVSMKISTDVSKHYFTDLFTKDIVE